MKITHKNICAKTSFSDLGGVAGIARRISENTTLSPEDNESRIIFTPICVLLTECVEHIEAVFNKLDLDEITSINKSIVASDAAHRKITFPLSVALNTAIQQRTCTAILDAQDINFEATMLLLSHLSKIPFGVLESGTLLDDDWDKLAAALELLNDAELYFMSKEPAPMERLIRKLNGLKISQKLGLIVVNGLKIEDENQTDALLNKKTTWRNCANFPLTPTLPSSLQTKLKKRVPLSANLDELLPKKLNGGLVSAVACRESALSGNMQGTS